MTDDQKKHLDDEEYQFPQDEYISSDSAAHTDNDSTQSEHEEVGVRPGRASRLLWLSTILDAVSRFQNKRILAVGGLVILFVILVSLFRLFQPSQVSVKNPVVVQQSIPIVASPPADTHTSLASLDSMQVDPSPMESKIQMLQVEMTHLQLTLGEAKQSYETLSETVSQLSAQVQTLTKQLNQAVVLMNASDDRGPRIVYHLRAIVPDRAWIMTNTGETISITIGDILKQYGTIQSIDPKLGIVTTSSGRKIEYGPNDF